MSTWLACSHDLHAEMAFSFLLLSCLCPYRMAAKPNVANLFIIYTHEEC